MNKNTGSIFISFFEITIIFYVERESHDESRLIHNNIPYKVKYISIKTAAYISSAF